MLVVLTLLRQGVSIDHCDVLELEPGEVASAEDMMQKAVLDGRPVVIRGGAAHFQARKDWRRDSVLPCSPM